jgi:hypothetical protein
MTEQTTSSNERSPGNNRGARNDPGARPLAVALASVTKLYGALHEVAADPG